MLEEQGEDSLSLPSIFDSNSSSFSKVQRVANGSFGTVYGLQIPHTHTWVAMKVHHLIDFVPKEPKWHHDDDDDSCEESDDSALPAPQPLPPPTTKPRESQLVQRDHPSQDLDTALQEVLEDVEADGDNSDLDNNDNKVLPRDELEHCVICLEEAQTLDLDLHDDFVAIENAELQQAASQESKLLHLTHALVMTNVCPFFSLLFHQHQGSFVTQFFMERSKQDLRDFIKNVNSLGMIMSILRQQLVAVMCLNGVLGVCHNDNYPQNSLVDQVDPYMIRFSFDGQDFEWFNHGLLIKMIDFGMASGHSFLDGLSSEHLPLVYYTDSTDHLPHTEEFFSDPQCMKLLYPMNSHVLQLRGLPVYARDCLTVLVSMKQSLRSPLGTCLQECDRFVMNRFVDCSMQELGKHIHHNGKQMHRRSGLVAYLKRVLSVDFLTDRAEMDASILQPPSLLTQTPLPVHVCGIPRSEDPKWYTKDAVPTAFLRACDLGRLPTASQPPSQESAFSRHIVTAQTTTV